MADERLMPLGDNVHFLRFVEYEDDPRAGAHVMHKKPDGSDCNGWITFEGSAWAKAFKEKIPTWKVLSWEPLTLEPSILCRTCGDHGHIRNGKWEKA